MTLETNISDRYKLGAALWADDRLREVLDWCALVRRIVEHGATPKISPLLPALFTGQRLCTLVQGTREWAFYHRRDRLLAICAAWHGQERWLTKHLRRRDRLAYPARYRHDLEVVRLLRMSPLGAVGHAGARRGGGPGDG